jgi:hypothetical protein
MGKRLKVGALTGFLLVAVAALVVATGGAAQASKVSKVGFAAPRASATRTWSRTSGGLRSRART